MMSSRVLHSQTAGVMATVCPHSVVKMKTGVVKTRSRVHRFLSSRSRRAVDDITRKGTGAPALRTTTRNGVRIIEIRQAPRGSDRMVRAPSAGSLFGGVPCSPCLSCAFRRRPELATLQTRTALLLVHAGSPDLWITCPRCPDAWLPSPAAPPAPATRVPRAA